MSYFKTWYDCQGARAAEKANEALEDTQVYLVLPWVFFFSPNKSELIYIHHVLPINPDQPSQGEST